MNLILLLPHIYKMIEIKKIIDTDVLKLYSTAIHTKWNEKDYKKYLDLLPVFIQDKIIKYKGWKERQLKISGKLLLQQLLIDLNCAHLSMLSNLSFTMYNRPYFASMVDFSISHSANKVLCVASTKFNVGLDIEFIKEIKPTDYYPYFNVRDIELLENAKYPVPLFYQLWTRKEALAKVRGIGVMEPLETISMIDKYLIVDNKKYEIRDLQVGHCYKGALVLNEEPGCSQSI